MRFERAKRLRYEKNPLADVSCEIRFPPLLKLVQYGPVDLQPSLQSSYPLLEIVELGSVRITPGASGAPEMNMPPPRRYVFKSQDMAWTLAVGADALVLSTSKYDRWEDFRDRMGYAAGLFVASYRPSRLLRIGLRYIDAVDPVELGMPAAPACNCLNPTLRGLGGYVKDGDLLESQNYALVKLDPRGKLGIRWGTGVRQTQDGPRTVCVLDGDFFDDSGLGVTMESLFTVLDDFNFQAGGLFQWAFTDELRARLGPKEFP